MTDGLPPMHLHEEAREAGWDDEQILEAIAAVSLEAFTAMVSVAGEVPGRWLDRGVPGARGGRRPSGAFDAGGAGATRCCRRWISSRGDDDSHAQTDRRGDRAASRAAAAAFPLYHEAVELVGRRWTGAILRVLMGGPLRFSEVVTNDPGVARIRLLSERMKELESRGLVTRTVIPGPLAARPLR